MLSLLDFLFRFEGLILEFVSPISAETSLNFRNLADFLGSGVLSSILLGNRVEPFPDFAIAFDVDLTVLDLTVPID